MRKKWDEIGQIESERLAMGGKDLDPCPEWSILDFDKRLDRYYNVLPWANNRMKLNVPEGYNDYINASPVALTSTATKQNGLKSSIQHKYICMQGPKRQTIDHTWHMIWHSLSKPSTDAPAVIIMLTPTHVPHPINPNATFEKCYQYYPLDENDPPLLINESLQLGEKFVGQVRFVSREEDLEGGNIELRKLAMTVAGEDGEKIIWHFLYPLWPDFGSLAEENVGSILALMELSRKKNSTGENPRLIHCSAGVGRSGTFIALEFLVGELRGGAWDGWTESEERNRDPVFETVNQLRTQRRSMVQAYEQFTFLYEVLRKLWEEKYDASYAGGLHGRDKHGNGEESSGEPPMKVMKQTVDDEIYEEN
ncbi:hypothetical protein B7494_g5847 [Chlorociboria aeruginascens]|nr:hypothetical protein B7494_g5847 [Chlorociboria aeruginascens]